MFKFYKQQEQEQQQKREKAQQDVDQWSRLLSLMHSKIESGWKWRIIGIEASQISMENSNYRVNIVYFNDVKGFICSFYPKQMLLKTTKSKLKYHRTADEVMQLLH